MRRIKNKFVAFPNASDSINRRVRQYCPYYPGKHDPTPRN